MPEEEKNDSEKKIEIHEPHREQNHHGHPPRSFHLEPHERLEQKQKVDDKKPSDEPGKLVLEDDDEEKPVQPLKHTENFDKTLKEMATAKAPKPVVIGSRPNFVIFLFEGLFRLGLAGLFTVIAAAAYMIPLEFYNLIEHNPLVGLIPNNDYLMGGIAAISGVLAVFVLIGWHKRGFLALAGLWLMAIAYFIAYPLFLA